MATKEIREFTPEEVTPAAADKVLLQRTSDNATRFFQLGNGVAAVEEDAFKTIQVASQSDVVADSPIDILTLVAGTGITITTNAGTDTITFSLIGGDFAEISVEGNAVSVSLPTQNVFVQITSYDTDGLSSGATPDHTQDHITVGATGTYRITCSMSLTVGTAGDEYEFRAHKNNGAVNFPNLHQSFKTSNTADVLNTTITGIINLTAGDTLEIFVRNTSAPTRTVTIEDSTLTLQQIP